MTDLDKAKAEILKDSLKKLYSTPQQAFMDGSYQSIKKTISEAIDFALKWNFKKFQQTQAISDEMIEKAIRAEERQKLLAEIEKFGFDDMDGEFLMMNKEQWQKLKEGEKQ